VFQGLLIGITPGETAKAEQLVAEKFGTEDWLQRVP